ncbi:MAG: hypothetical protein AB7P53_10080, partial [Candidatus Dadabacteria bacterium]
DQAPYHRYVHTALPELRAHTQFILEITPRIIIFIIALFDGRVAHPEPGAKLTGHHKPAILLQNVQDRGEKT